MEFEYVVKKQFAVNNTIYNVGDVVEMSDVEAKSLVEEGKLELHKEEKEIKVEVDTKSISEAIEKGFMKFAPTASQKEEKIGFGEYLQAIAKGDVESKNINITTDGQGAYATTEFTDPDIDVDILQQSGIASRVNVVNLSGTNNTYKFNVVNSMGGSVPAIVVEGNTINASQPTVTQFSIDLVKAAYRYDVTDEALEDTGALVSEINSQVPEEFAKFIEDGVINGNAAFTGIVGDTNTVTIAAEASQTAGSIVVENIDKMYSAAKNPNRCVWVVSRTAYAKIQNLEDTAGNRIFQGPNGLGPSPFGTLKGLPVQISDYAQAVGVVGDILLCDFGKYKMATKMGLKTASSAHVKFLSAETVFLFKYRLGGIPVGIKLTAKDLSEIASFIELASRTS